MDKNHALKQIVREWEVLGPIDPQASPGEIGFVTGRERDGQVTLDTREYNDGAHLRAERCMASRAHARQNTDNREVEGR